MNQHQPTAQQVAHWAQIGIVNMAGGQNVQPQQFGDKERVIGVVGVFDAAVLFHAGGVG